MTMPFGNAIAPATCVATPSGVINAMTPTVDGHLAPDVWTDVGQVDMADTRSVRLKAHEFEAGLEHPTIGQPADRLAHARYAVCDNLDVAVKVGGHDLVGPPV